MLVLLRLFGFGKHRENLMLTTLMLCDDSVHIRDPTRIALLIEINQLLPNVGQINLGHRVLASG
jgi:hypothetical protein